jgi:hypothetical protein
MFSRSHATMVPALAVALLLVAAAPASAAVVQISQFRALVGGVTPGDAPGFPVTLSRPGSYRLVTNLVLPAGATLGIDATADGVSLDLSGFAVIGPRTCAPEALPPGTCAPSIEDPGFVGIRARHNAHVHDGTVQGMGGVGVQAGSHARVVNVRVLWNSIFGLQLGPGSRLDDNLVAQNGQGVFVGNDCRATGNVVRLNTFAGLQMTGANCGYAGNVLSGFLPVDGGTPLGPNLCNGAPCP